MHASDDAVCNYTADSATVPILGVSRHAPTLRAPHELAARNRASVLQSITRQLAGADASTCLIGNALERASAPQNRNLPGRRRLNRSDLCDGLAGTSRGLGRSDEVGVGDATASRAGHAPSMRPGIDGAEGALLGGVRWDDRLYPVLRAVCAAWPRPQGSVVVNGGGRIPWWKRIETPLQDAHRDRRAHGPDGDSAVRRAPA